MAIYKETLSLTSNGQRPSFHDITDKVRLAVAASGIKNGIVVVQSQHTTCSIIFEEFVHDIDFNGYDFLQIDLIRLLSKLVPEENTEGMEYKYPGPAHLQFAKNRRLKTGIKFDPEGILNADSHLRGSLFGCSETFVIEDGKILSGEFGYIFFVDWDRRRVRERNCHILVMGEKEQ